MRPFLAGISVIIIFGLLIWYEISVWGECLTTNSWWYCLRIINP